MKYMFMFILIAVFSCLAVLKDVQANENTDFGSMTFELEQLKGSFQEMEQDYKKRISDLEEKVQRSQDIYIREREHDQVKPFYGTKGSLMNPDISIVGDMFYHFSDQSEGVGEFTDNDLFFREVELAIQGYIYPGIRAEFFPSWEVEDGEVEIEEAFINFLTLPFNTSLLLGRQRVRFGLVNPTHQEFQPWVDTPLAVQNFLGSHAYIDEGIDLSVMIPAFSIPVTIGLGAFDGDKSLGEHEDEHEEDGGETTLDIFESEPIEWKDHVFLAKINTNIPLSTNSDVSIGYSVMWDDNGAGPTAIHNGQFSFRYQFPYSYRKLLWQNEIYVADIDGRDVKSKGFYSMLKYNVNRFIDAGIRYDWSELGDNDDVHQWAVNPVLTWHLTETSYVRVQYRHGELEGFASVNEGLVQFVWGMGPHTHALEN